MKFSSFLRNVAFVGFVFGLAVYPGVSSAQNPLKRMLGMDEAVDPNKVEAAKRAAAELAAAKAKPFQGYTFTYSEGAKTTFETKVESNHQSIRKSQSLITKLVHCLSHPEKEDANANDPKYHRIEFMFLGVSDNANEITYGECSDSKPTNKALCFYVPPGLTDESAAKKALTSSGEFVQLTSWLMDTCEENEPYSIQLADGVPATIKDNLQGPGAENYQIDSGGAVRAVNIK